MHSKWSYFCLVTGLVCLNFPLAHAQIRYLTVPTLRSPLPAMALLPEQTPGGILPPPSAPRPASPAPRLVTLPVQPSLDKAELERRVIAFQKKRAEEGSASAQYELGLRYLKGEGV